MKFLIELDPEIFKKRLMHYDLKYYDMLLFNNYHMCMYNKIFNNYHNFDLIIKIIDKYRVLIHNEHNEIVLNKYRILI